MKLRIVGTFFAAVVFSAAALAQGVIPYPLNSGALADSFQVNTIASGGPAAAPIGFIDLTNTGGLGASATGPAPGINMGDICVNVYVFAPNQREMSCCSCRVSPNGLARINATDLGRYFPLPGVVVKLIATIPGVSATAPGTNLGPFTGTVCNAAAPFGSMNLALGMRAWATKVESIPTFPAATTSLVQTAFLPAQLNNPELLSIQNQCAALNGGGPARTCASCVSQ